VVKKLNCREIYGRTLAEVGKQDVRIVTLEADLGRATQSWIFRDAFPQRHFEMGIAEDNMVSTAAGLALSGKIPFVHSFSVFITGRCYDQIRTSVCLGNLSVRLVGSSCGLSDYGDGATHQCVEDIALMRALPNMTILAPADGYETAKAVRAAASHKGPVYIRINRNDVPVVTNEEEPLRIGIPSIVRQGGDVAIFANGYMVYKALCAAEKLQEQGISARVINVCTLKPIDERTVKEMAAGVKGVVTIEEHSIAGGLGSAIAMILAGGGLPVKFIAVADRFGQSALDYDQLLEHYGLTETAVIDAVKTIIGRD
jgi:transketolase